MAEEKDFSKILLSIVTDLENKNFIFRDLSSKQILSVLFFIIFYQIEDTCFYLLSECIINFTITIDTKSIFRNLHYNLKISSKYKIQIQNHISFKLS